MALPGTHGREYFVPPQSVNFTEASRYCYEQYGVGNGLAVIRNQQELKDLQNFLATKATPRTEYWIDGAFDQQQQQFYWTRLVKPDGTRSYFSQFVKSLLKPGVRQNNSRTRTTIVMLDRFTTQIVGRTLNQSYKFVCQRE